MRVVFLQDSAVNESLALTEVSGLLKANGHDTRLFLSDEEPRLHEQLKSWSAPLALIPCHVAGHQVALDLARRYLAAQPDGFVLMGGTHATFDPQIALQPQVHAVVVGEAEHTTLALADRLAAGGPWTDLPNLAFERDGQLQKNPLGPLIEDLDSLPLPDRQLYYRYPFIARFPWKKFTTGRGCVHSCSFCWNTPLRAMYEGRGTFTRRKSPERVVREIEGVMARHPLTSLHFSDDLFTVYPSWNEDFAPLYRDRIGVPFTCNTSVELVTERSVRALAQAGCRGVAIGVETGNEQLRSRILNKAVSNDDVRRAAALIKGQGMELITFNMLASPGETLADGLATVRLNREIGADHVRVNLAVPLPHTDFELEQQQAGTLDAAYDSHRVRSLEHPEVAFSTSEARAFLNLFYLFRPAVHLPGLARALPRLVHLPPPKLLDGLRLLIPLEEKGITALGWRDGLRYFRHVGDPHKRTANYVTLI